jgi:DNA helicase-2/ATP-dependent DNA helicase PcrA
MSERPDNVRPMNGVIAGLDPEQQQAALAPIGPVCILAGAGTGKTRAITARIAHMVNTEAAVAGSILAVTFTTRAAAELRSRLRSLGAGGVQARTFHSAAHRQLSYFWPSVFGGQMPRLQASKISLVAGAAGRIGLKVSGTELRDLSSEIEWAAACLISPEAYPAAAKRRDRQPPREPAVMAKLIEAYSEAKRQAEVLDFDDLLLLTAAAIEGHPSVAGQLRQQYRHFVVDEYQDVTPLQQRLLDAWLGEGDSLCVVGDPQQTIYSFTGASASFLVGFEQRYPTATVVELVRDYRSTPQVVGLANSLIKRAGPVDRAMPVLSLVAQQPDGPEVSWLGHDDEPAEAAAVAARIKALVDGGLPASEVAVLYRVNAQSEAYEAALSAVGLPCLVRGGERFFERPEVREAVVLLRGASRAADTSDGASLPDQVREVLRALRWEPDAPPAAGGAQAERWQNLAALSRLAEDFAQAQESATLIDLVAELTTRAADQHVPTVEGVTLASLHAAKGLEWDAVFLVGLVDGTMPLVHATSTEEIAEERRLLYVGVTRARRHLTMSWAAARAPGGRRSRQRSRFLDGVAPALAPTAPAGGKSRRGGKACRVCGAGLSGATALKLGRCVSCPSGVDDALLDTLRSWRTGQAKTQSQPAFCVFTDATLLAIAERKPASREQLATISGVGKAKLDKYGPDVLDLIRQNSVA